jgi:hypothetical protein
LTGEGPGRAEYNEIQDLHDVSRNKGAAS